MSSERTISLVVPYRNWDSGIFRVALHSLELQTKPVDEIILVDIASSEPFKTDIEMLCGEYDVKYYHLPINLSDKAIDVHLWNTCFNFGVRKATSDLIIYSGVDRIYEKNMVECVLDSYEWNISRGKKESFFCAKVYNLFRTPKLSELKNFDALIKEAEWRGGFGFWGASSKLLHQIHGLDETIRWYEDWDLAGRAKRAGASILWLSHGKPKGFKRWHTRVLHLADHPKSRKQHRGHDVQEVATRGKSGISGDPSIVRNGEDWGLLTEAKLERAESLLNLSKTDFANLRAKEVEPLAYR